MQAAFVSDVSRRSVPMAAESPISVAISAASPAVRSRLETLAKRSGARVTAESERHEVLLLAVDASTPLPNSVTALSLLSPAAAFVCILWSGDAPAPGAITRWLRAGIAGVLSPRIDSSRFRAALRAIHAGLQVIDPAWLKEEARFSSSHSAEDLSDREQQVLRMMADGLGNKEIASRLGISTHTVKFHISSILGKLGASSRTEAVSIGIRNGQVLI
jgi:two-component system, NarL family, response regulator YdfI